MLSPRLTDANFGADGGDFLAAALTGGVPHPTGYPTYTLLARLVQLIPAGSPVARGTLASLLPACLAGGLLSAWVLRYWQGSGWLSPAGSALAGLAWGVSPLLFGQAVIVEVHGLQALFSILTLAWAARLWTWQSGRHPLPLLLLALAAGLGMGNHITGSLLVLPALAGLAVAVRRGMPLHLGLGVLASFAGGLLVYLTLPLAARAFPPINWGNAQTWPGFWWLVSGTPYRDLLGTPLPLFGERLRSLAALLVHQVGIPGLLAGVVGAVQAPFRQKAIHGLLAWTFGVYVLFAALYNTSDSTAYLIPAAAAFCAWIGRSLQAVSTFKLGRIQASLLVGILLFASLAAWVPGIRSEVDPRSRDAPARFAEAVLNAAPQGALVITNATGDTFPLWYYHFGLRQRTDLHILVRPLTQFDWYRQTLPHTYPDLVLPPPGEYPQASWGYAIIELNASLGICRTQTGFSAMEAASFTCEAQP